MRTPNVRGREGKLNHNVDNGGRGKNRRNLAAQTSFSFMDGPEYSFIDLFMNIA